MTVLPLYHRIYLSLRDRVLNGAYPRDAAMPGEQQLARDFGVSRVTLRKALEMLAEEGLVERRQGKRTFARPLNAARFEARNNLGGSRAGRERRERLPGEISQEYETVAPDKQLARQFGSDAAVARIRRTRWQRGKPYCLVTTFLPLAVAEAVDWEAAGNRSVIEVVEEAGFPFTRTDQVITAVAADEGAAAALRAPLAAPLLCISGLFLDAQDRPVMRKDGYFLPESFEYRMRLYKPDR